MKQNLLIVLALILVGLVGFDSYEFIQKMQIDIQIARANIQQTKMDDNNRAGAIVSLNQLKDGLKAQRQQIYNSELIVRQKALSFNYDYDKSLMPRPPTSSNKNSLFSDVVLNPPFLPTMPSEFNDAYINYLNLVYDYNSQVSEINFKAVQLGEPPVPLLEQYNPVLR